jgi:hypothetical protein
MINALVVTELSKFIDWAETGFEEIRAHAVFRSTTFPRSGLLARNDIRFARNPSRTDGQRADHFLQADISVLITRR